MPYAAALDALAQLTVPGIVHHYGVDALPTRLHRAQLPCLLVMPLDVERDRLFRDAGEAFTAATFTNSLQTVSHTATHLLLTAAVGSARPLRWSLPALAEHVDAIVAALAADPLLSDTLREPAHVRVEPGVYSWGGTAYYGCAFRHTWLLTVE